MKACSYIYSLVLFFAAAGQIFSSCAGHDSHEELSPELELLMVRLDSVLEKAPEYTAQKEERIAKLRLSFENTGNPERRYWIASDIFDEYRAYDSDSAHAWIDRCIDIAGRIGRSDLVRDMELTISISIQLRVSWMKQRPG